MLLKSTDMHALNRPIAIAMAFILTAGLLYSAVCDTSCSLFGCSPVAQSNLAQSSDPHAHCHAKKDQSEQSVTSNKIRFRSSEPERHNQSQIPECEIHAFATVLSPRVKGASSRSLQLLHLDVARLADSSFWSLSNKPSLIRIATPFRPPPTLAKLSTLRI
ncbi:MAG TPA: hypothetical protein VJX74_12815 [Blastocatellia bacterium]|nr:hypothetical protein [Blastocatellia bacterium]